MADQNDEESGKAGKKNPPPPSTSPMGIGASTSTSTSAEYQLKKYLLLLATLVATVTYAAGLNPPGASWLEDDVAEGHLAGDSILRDTSFVRYVVFYYFNAISFAASLLVGLLLLVMQREASFKYLLLMWTVMLVDGLGLIGAYAAGISHDKFTTICASVLVSGVAAYAAFAFACFVKKHLHHLLALRQRTPSSSSPAGNSSDRAQTPTEKHEMLLVLAIFAATGAYVAGLNPPGGFWRSTVEGHHNAGDPVLQRLHPTRYKAFFFFNTTAFVASLLIIIILLDKKLTFSRNVRLGELYVFIALTLIGLVGAYSAGSCRQVDTTIYVNSLIGAVIACILLQAAAIKFCKKAIKKFCKASTKNSCLCNGEGSIHGKVSEWLRRAKQCCLGPTTQDPSTGNEDARY